MKATYTIKDEMLDNENQFQDAFFERFTLGHAPQPLQLTEKISKNYLFPTFYGNVTCAIGIFLCSYPKALEVVQKELGSGVKPVKMTRGRSLVAFSCYEYKNVYGVLPYNEIAMTIPVMANSLVNVPVLPMVLDKFFSKFGYYIFGMPVTSKENQIRGNEIWNLPKTTNEIDIYKENGDCITICSEESGKPYFELHVPMDGTPTDFDVTSNLYTKKGSSLLKSETNFKARFNINKYMDLLFKKGATPDRTYLKIGDSPSAQVLNDLEIEKHPFQFRFAEGMNSCFDLPDPDFKEFVK
ncbi:MAG: acetoacetate decarboxylase family protein [Desulfobacteraceae bacterium]|nr:acetoacetate decarboxylase family protein [Desulfobacteraceae bacterium]